MYIVILICEMTGIGCKKLVVEEEEQEESKFTVYFQWGVNPVESLFFFFSFSQNTNLFQIRVERSFNHFIVVP